MNHYEVRNGDYVLVKKETGEIINNLGKSISIALTTDDKDEFIMHKHGSEGNVNKWAETARTRFRGIGMDDMADEVRVISGPFPLSEINWLIESSGRMKTFYKKVMQNEMPCEPLIRLQ